MKIITDYTKLADHSIRYLAVDVETTGLSSYSDRVVELGALLFKGADLLDSLETLVNPGIPIPEVVSGIHGITDAMVSESPSFSSLLKDLERLTEGAILLAHNATFDMGFLNAELARDGRPSLDVEIVDTLHMARKAFPGLKSYALGSLAETLGIEVQSAHRAGDDCRVCYELFVKCRNTLNPGGQLDMF